MQTAPFNPFDHREFYTLICTQDRGTFITYHTPEKQSPREAHVYFRWMPLYSPPGERYLIVAGITEQSITAPVAAWVSLGQWISMAVTFILNTWLIILLLRIGNIVERQKRRR